MPRHFSAKLETFRGLAMLQNKEANHFDGVHGVWSHCGGNACPSLKARAVGCHAARFAIMVRVAIRISVSGPKAASLATPLRFH